MELVFVGAGRLATQFAKALHGQGHTIKAVYSRTMASAEALAAQVGAVPTTSVNALPLRADAFILAVKDAVLPALIPQLAAGRQQCPMFHTAGSVPMSVLGVLAHYGVIYPMQTFSKEREVDFSRLPIFIEGNDDLALQLARRLALSVSNCVTQADSNERRYLHLAAVFACNFSNHCYALAAEILARHGMAFDALLPLIEETAQKVRTMHPRDAQTGPAVRFDENVIQAQLQLLADQPHLQELYMQLSQSIHRTAGEKL